MKKKYTSFKEIEQELTILQLRRQIALEEIQLSNAEFKKDIAPNQWTRILLKWAKKYGISYLLQKVGL